MGFKAPKQFELLAGQAMALYSLNTFLGMPEIKSVWVGVSSEAPKIPGSEWPDSERLNICLTGGATRHETVLNTLKLMSDSGVPGDDWVLVHDAARPGLTSQAVRRLVDAVTQHTHISGGILAMPMADTLKLASPKDLACIEKTLPRDGLWLAQTPQMFRLQPLREALEDAITKNLQVTDEASAMEQAGCEALLVSGEWRNLKVTYPQDWSLMSELLGTK